MSKISFALPFLVLFPLTAFAQQASDYFPDEVPAVSIFKQTLLEAEEEPETGPDVVYTLNEITDEGDGVTRYDYTRDNIESVFYAVGDTLYTSFGELFDPGFLDDFGIELDFDFSQRVDLMRLSNAQGSSWVLFETQLTLDVPDFFYDVLPDNITIDDEFDVDFKLHNRRLDNVQLNTPLGMLDAVAFKPNLTVNATFYVLILNLRVPVTVNIVQDYGNVFYFAEGYGIIKEDLQPEIIKVTNSQLGIDEELARVPGRILDIDSFEIAPDTSTDHDGQIPIAVRLDQNYPNPFNPTTAIGFYLPEVSDVLLEVFSIEGRRVAVLSNGRMAAGTHSMQFDGNGLASGVYVFRLTAGQQVLSRKMTLVK